MAWKEVGIALVEFVGGLVALRVGMPMESLVILACGTALTLMGLLGFTRILSQPRAGSRPYSDSSYGDSRPLAESQDL